MRAKWQCSPGSCGAEMFQNMLKILGDAGVLQQDNDAAQLYWLTQC
jgi:hypothetical protein